MCLLQSQVGSTISIVSRQSALRSYYLIEILWIHPAAPIHPHPSGITRGSRGFRYSIEIKIGLCCRINDSSQTGCQQETGIDTFIRKAIIPSQICLRKYASQLDITCIVDGCHIAAIVDQYITVNITFQIGMCIKITQSTTLFQDKFRLSESASFIGFEFQFIHIVCLARFRMNVIFYQFYDFILVGRECKTAVPTEISPTMSIRQHSLETVVTYISCLHIQFIVSRRYGKPRVECLIVSISVIE